MTYLCACGQLRLPVDNPVDNSPPRERDSMPVLNQDKALVSDDVREAVLSAVDALAAQVEALHLMQTEILAMLLAPMSQQERIDRIRAIRGDLP